VLSTIYYKTAFKIFIYFIYHVYSFQYGSIYGRCYTTGEYTTTISEQRFGKHVPAETNKHVNNIRAVTRQPAITTMNELLGAVFSVGSAPRLYKEDPRPAEED
jgi:hypothetical protein